IRNSNEVFTVFHSLSRMEKTKVSRRLPFPSILWFRKIPSCLAPKRRMAFREGWLWKCVRNSTAMHRNVSKACFSNRYLHSVLSPVRCTRLAYQVDPISTRLCWASTFIKRVLPTMVFVFLSITIKGRETPICCSERALFKYESMVAGEGTVVYHNSQSLPSDAANARSTLWDF